ncbi:molybdate ABC transporter substrate-binding protein [Roseateles sp. BYS180W]|uniref:Molybdate ABC transporter substrate-binding protein n=1 Tax=Roseateles rivi TaxID=3299028 RepID=A0ABW7FSE5_9BURK
MSMATSTQAHTAQPARRRPLLMGLLGLLGALSMSAATLTHAQPRAELTVSAAASLGPAYKALAARFEAQNPGVQVRLNTAASGTLVQQLAQGAPVDVLATADQESMDLAQRQGLIQESSRHNVVGNTLVLVQAKGGAALGSLQALAQTKGVQRIAIGHAGSVPAGRWARAVLEQAGLWQAVQARLITTLNVRQALDYVLRGEVDAAFVYASDIHGSQDRLGPMLPLGTPTPIRYAQAVTRHSQQPVWAQAWVSYSQSPAALQLLRAHGFSAP